MRTTGRHYCLNIVANGRTRFSSLLTNRNHGTRDPLHSIGGASGYENTTRLGRPRSAQAWQETNCGDWKLTQMETAEERQLHGGWERNLNAMGTIHQLRPRRKALLSDSFRRKLPSMID